MGKNQLNDVCLKHCPDLWLFGEFMYYVDNEINAILVYGDLL